MSNFIGSLTEYTIEKCSIKSFNLKRVFMYIGYVVLGY